MTFQFRLLIAGLLAATFLLTHGAPVEAQFADAAADTAAAGDAEGGDENSTLLSADEITALVAPVALYPDELLAIVLPAATNPIQVVEAQRFLDQQKSNPDSQPNPDWDPAVIALINYPQVIKQMNDDLTWTQDLGIAVMDQQADVMNAIQAARAAASEAGYLQSNDQQVVVNDNDNIVIESAQPDVVYVPTYDPAPIVNNTYVEYPPPVYSEPYPSYYSPAATFFTGAIVGATFAYAFDWGDDDIDIDCCDNDVNIDNSTNINRGDTTIGSGNTNIDKTKIQEKFNGDRKANADGKMKWSSQKARQKSSLPRESKAARASRPTSANIQKQLAGGAKASALPSGAGKGANAQNRVKNSKTANAQSQRGQGSLSQTKKPKQQLRQDAGNKQQMQRQQQQQRPQKQMQNRQLKQKQGGAFQQPSNRNVKAQSSRGNKSLNKGGHSKPKRPQRRN